jgi:signal transduction histidine kinase
VFREFIVENRSAILARTRTRIESRLSPQASVEELENCIPQFLTQLVEALRLAESSDVIDHEALGQSARRHGNELQKMGLTIGLVVRDYGDVCQAITELAIEVSAPISAHEFQTLNLCLDHATAAAVSEFARQNERVVEGQGLERLGILAHELRNLLNTATLAFEVIKSGRVATGGSTALLLDRSLSGLRDLIDRSLADVRLDAGVERHDRIRVADFIEEVEISASIQAGARGIRFSVASEGLPATIEGDRQILAAALANLLQNAFKFTAKHGHVSFTTRVTPERVLFAVEDECGGLPPGKIAELFVPFEQRGEDRSGVGLGLGICLRAAKANGGEIHVEDRPGKGCVFILDLPRVASLS